MPSSFAGVFLSTALPYAVVRSHGCTTSPNVPTTILGTPVRRTSPSSAPPVKITHTGIIGVLDPSNNILGYVSEDLGNGGTQYVYDPSLANALVVTFQTDRSGSGTKLDITAVVSSNTSLVWNYPHFPLLELEPKLAVVGSYPGSRRLGFYHPARLFPVSRHGSSFRVLTDVSFS